MKIVLDTNVLVSGLLSPFGPPAEIVRLVASGRIVLCHDARILAEYSDVLLRPKFRFDREAVGALLAEIQLDGEPVAAFPLRHPLPDRADEPFLEVALASGAEALVTGNLRHFPARLRQGVAVVAPAAFLEGLRGRRDGAGRT